MKNKGTKKETQPNSQKKPLSNYSAVRPSATLPTPPKK